MGTWHDYLKSEGTPPEWPYPIKFGEEKEIETDVLVLGGGISRAYSYFRDGMMDFLESTFIYPESLKRLKIRQLDNDETALEGAALLCR